TALARPPLRGREERFLNLASSHRQTRAEKRNGPLDGTSVSSTTPTRAPVPLTYPTLGSSTKPRRQGMTGPLPERKSTKGRTTNQRPKAEAGLSADCRSVC